MTDRINALTVVLNKDIRIDDVEGLINAIEMLRGVLSVSPHVADTLDSHIAENRVRHDLGQKLFDIVYPNRSKP